MATQRTLGLVKPDATARGLVGKIVARYEDEGFRVLGMKMLRLSRADAEAFYAVHRERPFFSSLTAFMSSGPIVALALERQDAIAHLRQVMGATNPEDAEDGTIRAQHAESIERNSVHGSDAPETAAQELAFFFSERELLAGT